MKRVKKVIADPNPLFMKWLNEFRVEAINKSQSGLVKIFDLCIKSLGCYPLPLESALQCGALNGFGKTVCRRLEQKHQEYKAEVSKQSTGGGFDCPLSPVSAPLGSPLRQIQNITPPKVQPPSPKLHKNKSSTKRDVPHALPSKSSVFDVPENAGEDDQYIDLRSQEDKDLELALALSQAEVPSSPLGELSQEEKDMEFARQLQEQFNRENAGVTNRPLDTIEGGNGELNHLDIDDDLPDIDDGIPNRYTDFDCNSQDDENRQLDKSEADEKMARQLDIELNHSKVDQGITDIDKVPGISDRIKDSENISSVYNDHNSSKHEMDDEEIARQLDFSLNHSNMEHYLPDINDKAPIINDRPTNNSIDSKNHPKRSNAFKHDLGDQQDNSFPPLKRAKKTVHDISVRSDDEDNDCNHIKDFCNPISKILNADPVLKIGNTSKGLNRGKKNLANSQVSSAEDFNNISNKSCSNGNSSGVSKSRTPTKKEYVPKTRSGAYAVLLTLHSKSQEDSYQGYMSKAELQLQAQPLADESFTVSSVRTEFQYSAWSGVSTLVKHELVKRWGNPVKFDITEKGRQLASKLVSTESRDESISVNDNSTKTVGSKSHNSSRSKKPQETSTSRVCETVSVTDSATKDVVEDTIGKLLNSDPVLNKEKKKPKSGKKINISNTHVENIDIVTKPDENIKLPIDTARNSPSSNLSNAQFDLGESIDWDQSFGVPDDKLTKETSGSSIPEETPLPLPLALQQMYKKQLSSEGPTVDRHRPEVVLRAGTFDILLCVDNTEVKGGGSGGRQSLKTETVRHLRSCRVNHDERNLNLGDFLWIAREKVDIEEGTFVQRQPKELVLPYIVERKRLDDLWQSVKDGRYEEQKFRMKGCGLGHLFYLIEDHPKQQQFWGRAGGGGNLVTPEAIEQAIANTAVQEGFTIKKTADQKATIEYLTIFTRLLSKKYSGLTLSSCTQTDLSEGLVANRDTTLLQFTEFNDASRKTKKLQLQEVFAKMLLRLKGLSADMAQAIIQQFPTPNSLISAFSKVHSETAKLKIIQDISYGLEAKRKIPKSVAEAILKFWTNSNLA